MNDEAGAPLVIIGCGKAKRDRPCPAYRLYTGSLFAQELKWAASVTAPGRIRILSAKYGLVSLFEVIAPYDVTVGDCEAITASGLRAQLALLPEGCAYAVCGNRYRKLLDSVAAGLLQVIYPFPALPLDKMMACLKQHRGYVPVMAGA